MIEAYKLMKAGLETDPDINYRPIRAIYKSKQRSFSKLTAVDQANSWKSDALNTGLQLSPSTYVGSIDVDCLLFPEALLHLVKYFLQASHRRVIAVGGVM